jgi:hypothetical protein
METFETEVELSIIGDNIVKPGNANVKIKWNLEIEMRNYGVKGIMIYAPDQTLEFTITRYNEETDEEEETTETFEFKDIKIEGQYRNIEGFESVLHSGIYPKGMELWKNKTTLFF